MPIDILTEETPLVDGCPILSGMKAFVMDQGAVLTLEHVLRDLSGVPISLSQSDLVGGSVQWAAREILATGPPSEANPVWRVTAAPQDAAAGVVRAVTPTDFSRVSGVYMAQWIVKTAAGTVRKVDRSLVIVERSLAAADDFTQGDFGPPLLAEIRQVLLERAGNDNEFLDRQEFSSDQLAAALSRPIAMWNEATPAVGYYDTRNFPFRENWMTAAIGLLLDAGAHNYRRNDNPSTGGTITVRDKAKEAPYLAASRTILAEYRQWMASKKLEMELNGGYGTFL